MKLFSLIAILLFASASLVLGQPPDTLWTRMLDWAATWPPAQSHLNDALAEDDGTYIVAGWIPNDGANLCLVKFDAEGETLWTRGSGGIFDLERCSDGYIMAGSPLVQKRDFNGDTMWTREALPHGWAVCRTLHDGYLVLGGWGEQDFPFTVRKMDAVGQTVWQYNSPASVHVACGGIAETADHGSLVTYSVQIGMGVWDIYVFRLGSNGDSLETIVVSEDAWTGITRLWPTTDGQVRFAGSRLAYGDTRAHCLITLGQDGTVADWREMRCGRSDVTNMAETDDGGAVVSIDSAFGTGYLLRFDANGDSLWAARVPPPAGYVESALTAVAPQHDGGYFFTGVAKESHTDSGAAWIGRIDAEPPSIGNVLTAEPEGNGIALSLHTEWEYRCTYHEFWKALAPDSDFQLIATVSSDGYVPGGAYYGHIDEDVVIGQTCWYFVANTNEAGRRWEYRDGMVSAQLLNSAVPLSPIAGSFFIQAFPNPFNPATTISFSLPRAGEVKLAVYDVTGRERKVLAARGYTAGEHSIAFDGSDLPSGLYFATLQAGSSHQTQKLMLLK